MPKPLSNADKKLYAIIDAEKKAAAGAVATCNTDACPESWHWCPGCESHLDEDNTCTNCD
jgi:hypothetical protein